VIERLKQRLKDDDVSPTDSTVAELRHAAQELLADTLMGDIQSASSGLLDKHLWQHVSIPVANILPACLHSMTHTHTR
jgi:hypothetical protein